MSQVVSGTIDSIRAKEVNTKFGPKNVYHAMINGQDVNLGFKHNYSEGETVSLNCEHKYGSLQAISTAPAGVSDGGGTSVAAGPTTYKEKSLFPVELNSTGTSICRQSSLKAAVEVVHDMVELGTLENLDYEGYVEKVIETSYAFTDFATGQREVKAARQQEQESK